MGYEHLEHDGNEDFAEYETRGDKPKEEPIAFSSEQSELELELQEEARLAKEQEEWLNFNNPALWDGEI